MKRAAAPRRALLGEIRRQVRLGARYHGRDALRPATLAAMAAVDRALFVEDVDRAAAYDDRPLRIGLGQTISQPSLVALMTDLLDLPPRARVLEIGTGSGYQAAILSRLADTVHSVEIVEALALRARQRLAVLGCDNVEVHLGDGCAGWPAAAPYHAIIVTAAASALPPSLAGQLVDDGVLLAPLADPHGQQWLRRLVRAAEGITLDQALLPVTFVPLRDARD